MPSPPVLSVTVEATVADRREFTFSRPFRIGRGEDSDVCIPNEYVSRNHAEVVFENGAWWITDLYSSNGIYVGDQRFKRVSVVQQITIRLGIQGPSVTLQIAAPQSVAIHPSGDETILARYVDRYFGKTNDNEPVGEHTMFVRKAFAKVQTKQKRRYGLLIGILALSLVGVGGYVLILHQQVKRQKAMAEDLFYAMKSLDVDIANLERAVASSNNQQGEEVIRKYEQRRKEMERNYDRFLATLHVYNPKMTDQERLVLRVARIFGECELDMPPDFVAEVNRYIKVWQSSGRLPKAVSTAKANGYTSTITQELLAQQLPPQFFYLALQESNFDPYVSGPVTRKGIAKGMWQFIPETAVKYGLHLGPLADLRRPDPADDRDHYEKETTAAAAYLKDLFSTDAQASGLLVMACYNWGEDQVLPLVRSMPANPRERNFWQLLRKHREQIPQETYDYVFYIISAAVIGENPRLFGFDFDNPLADVGSDNLSRVIERNAMAKGLFRDSRNAKSPSLPLPIFVHGTTAYELALTIFKRSNSVALKPTHETLD
jgi:membrane-bound lytic murein transglycosylase D